MLWYFNAKPVPPDCHAVCRDRRLRDLFSYNSLCGRNAQYAVVFLCRRTTPIAIAGQEIKSAIRALRHCPQPPIVACIEPFLIRNKVGVGGIDDESVQMAAAQGGEEKAPLPLRDQCAAVPDRAGRGDRRRIDHQRR